MADGGVPASSGDPDETVLRLLAEQLTPADGGGLRRWSYQVADADDPSAALRDRTRPILAALRAYADGRTEDAALLLDTEPDALYAAFTVAYLTVEMLAHTRSISVDDLTSWFLEVVQPEPPSDGTR